MSRAEEWRALESARQDEAYRHAIRRALGSLPQRLLAPIIGISRKALRCFLEMSDPADDVRARIDDWFLDQPEPDVAPPVVGLALLAQELPHDRRMDARRALVATLLALCDDAGKQPPAWLVAEAGASRQARASRR